MNGKLTLSFSVATFIAAVGVMFLLADMRGRLDRVEKEVQAQRTPAASPPARGVQPVAGEEEARAEPTPTDPPPVRGLQPVAGEEDGAEAGDGDGDGEESILDSKDPMEKLDWLIEKVEEIDTNTYEYYNDQIQEIYQLKRATAQMKVTVMRILQGLRESGEYPGLAPSLLPRKAPMNAEDVDKFRAEAVKFGLQVEAGKVTARAVLNGSQDKAYPVEYFMTRFPDAGHETLVHLMGTAKVDDFREPPFPSLDGLATAFYKALLVAGFAEGQGSHPDPDSPDPRAPQWVLATGDTVYIYVRYEEGGKPKLARATDWMVDPETGLPLPEDCFKFTGSLRIEHPDTGEEMLLGERSGRLISVWPDRSALVEVALKSAVKNNYQYNWSRLPKHDGKGPFYVDLIFSKTPLKK